MTSNRERSNKCIKDTTVEFSKSMKESVMSMMKKITTDHIHNHQLISVNNSKHQNMIQLINTELFIWRHSKKLRNSWNRLKAVLQNKLEPGLSLCDQSKILYFDILPIWGHEDHSITRAHRSQRLHSLLKIDQSLWPSQTDHIEQIWCSI